MATQHVRRSQFITTYGPGAIIEGRSGPRVILMPERGLFSYLGLQPSNLEIQDRRLELVLGAKVYRLPSNVELGREDGSYLYRTAPFPSWRRCVRHEVLYQRWCPECGEGSRSNDRSDAWRFIMACKRGHMDDVDWILAVHGVSRGCRVTYLRCIGGGGTLSETMLICPACGASRTLGSIYYDTQLRCSGRYPEREVLGRAERQGCDEPARVIHRGALNLRIPEVRSVLLVPPLETALHRLLMRGPVRGYLSGVFGSHGRVPEPGELRAALDGLVASGLISSAVRNQILAAPDEALRRAMRDVLEYQPPATMLELMEEEFRALQQAARVGHPPSPPAPGMLYNFEVVLSDVREMLGIRGRLRLRITPISRLTVLMVQTGYRRLDPVDSDVVSIAHTESDGTCWLPGMELQGEGVFIESVEPFTPTGPAAEQWTRLRRCARHYPDHLFVSPDDPRELDPLFVWWHTLSHRLINAMGIDSGFSSAAIRERIYLTGGRNPRGGVLLYTAQSGGDGTHGGLIALVSEFQRILSLALANLDACSNDPLCLETRVQLGSYAGAACYACLLVSETSCEHRNMWLDRRVLLENMP